MMTFCRLDLCYLYHCYCFYYLTFFFFSGTENMKQFMVNDMFLVLCQGSDDYNGKPKKKSLLEILRLCNDFVNSSPLHSLVCLNYLFLEFKLYFQLVTCYNIESLIYIIFALVVKSKNTVLISSWCKHGFIS